ncbi:hypothetical protein [Leptospira borgpetersenii]|uniref:NERD domain-containing protein n=1 Tax=Leptospira borgpetersenii serovar Ballum TaxID=280505 RepID=A0A0E3BJR1_LEPBO|nr:hypothetical protein [Leptospira borgpetersenii]ALO25283.1 hypothetical protein LBBP_00969 [Leptospira borgpetersenii serovar Ballum]ANH00235.1 Uncharacterized protein LB4E_0770 [Leptospira borgpetersenii str. 4E]EKQ98464.1 hypothetical protein LEP1GSC121_3309 [Leptospira borgpetersenii serovar Castellonis str. 200801910]KGE21955.1 hypothetical protein IQ66_19280 [Leptospira borgpetersenii serovar Ballum]MBE8161531.1 hypothetical protein [Leptospira borgpetersenii serovar Ballum]
MNKRKSSRRKSRKYDQVIKKSSYLTTIESPLAGLSLDEQKKVITDMGNLNSRSLRDSLNALTEIIYKHNPLSILSILTYYYLSSNVDEDGVDLQDSENPIGQPQVEIFQALTLKVKEESWGKMPVFPDTVQYVIDNLKNITSSFSLSRMKPEILDLTVEEQSNIHFQEMIKGHTTGVRYWGYFNQVIVILTELYSPFDISTNQKIGFSISDAIVLFKTLVDDIGNLMTDRAKYFSSLSGLNSESKIIRKYYESIGANESVILVAIEKFAELKLSHEELLIRLIVHDDQILYKMFRLSTEDLSKKCGINEEALSKIVDYFSFKPGELESRESEHFFLDNPIWDKPIMKLDEGYFCFIAQMFFGSSFFIFDSMLSEIDKDSLHQRKSKYLEQKIEEIVKRRFPELLTVPKTEWRDGDIKYETDLITFIDSYAIIIEAKSAKVSKAGLRGAPDRVKRHIRELIVEPSIQSKRFEDRLWYLIANPEIKDPLREKLPVDLRKVRKIIRISVSLEDFATVQSNLNRFKDTNWFPESFVPCPTLNLADFETVFDFLEHPVQILHYFERRAELERDSKVEIIGDELDYLGFYLSTLLSQGYVNGEGKDHLIITSMSSPIDHYYLSKDLGKEVPKPKPKITNLFKEIFIKLEERSVPGWTEIGVALNMFTPDDQEKLEKYLNQLKLKLMRKWDSHNLKNLLLYVSPVGNEYGLAYVLFNNATLHRRYEFIENAASQVFETKHIHKALLIAKNIDDDNVPYHYIAICYRKEPGSAVKI